MLAQVPVAVFKLKLDLTLEDCLKKIDQFNDPNYPKLVRGKPIALNFTSAGDKIMFEGGWHLITEIMTQVYRIHGEIVPVAHDDILKIHITMPGTVIVGWLVLFCVGIFSVQFFARREMDLGIYLTLIAYALMYGLIYVVWNIRTAAIRDYLKNIFAP